MNYKLSKSNYYLPASSEMEQRVYVFNTLTRNLVRFPGTINTEEVSRLGQNDIDALYSMGIFVDEKTDEIEAMSTYMDIKKYEQKRLYVTIIPTDACNFRCIYCYQPEKAAIMTEGTLEKILKWFERNLRYYDELSLGWFGGEPLLQPSIVLKLLSRIHDLCKINRVAMISSVTTNGYTIDIDLFKQLLTNGLLYYQITVDGDEATHNLQRPHKTNKDSYGRIMQNLSDMKKLPHRYRFEVGIRINISGSMKKGTIYGFIDKMAELFAEDKRFVIIWQWVRDWGGVRIAHHDKGNLVQTSNVCAEYIEYAKSKGLSVADIVSTMTGTDSCEAYYKNGYVFNHDGRVFKCAMCLGDEKNNCIGYIDDNGIMRVDSSKELPWLTHDKITGECAECVYLPLCYTSRCHYSMKVRKSLKCLEYKDLILPQIEQMIEKHNYHVVGSFE